MTLVAPRIVNDLPYVSTVNHEIYFAWQAHYLVKFMCHFLWQAQHLVKFMCHFLWQAQHLVRCVGDACSIYFTGNICASCLCVSAHYTTKFVSPRSISSSNIILRNSFHQEVYLAATLISFVRVAV